MKMMTTLVFACLMLVLAFGCQKEGDNDKNGQASAGSQQALGIQQGTQEEGEEPIEAKLDGFSAMESGIGSFGSKDLDEVDEADFFDEGQIAFLRQSLIDMAPDAGFKVDEKAGTLWGNGLPEGGVPMDKLVSKVARYMAVKEIKFDEGMAVRMIDMMLMELSPPPAVPERTPPPGKGAGSNVDTGRAKDTAGKGGDETKKPAAEGPPSQRKYTPELPFAKKIVGDWKSVREEHLRISVDHDQGYFELVTFTPEGKAEWQVFVQGERTSRAEYTYSYNERTGKIELHPTDNSPTVVMSLFQPDDDQEVLYITREDKKSAIVYERIGEGGYRKPIEEFQGGNISTGANDKVKK